MSTAKLVEARSFRFKPSKAEADLLKLDPSKITTLEFDPDQFSEVEQGQIARWMSPGNMLCRWSDMVLDCLGQKYGKNAAAQLETPVIANIGRQVDLTIDLSLPQGVAVLKSRLAAMTLVMAEIEERIKAERTALKDPSRHASQEPDTWDSFIIQSVDDPIRISLGWDYVLIFVNSQHPWRDKAKELSTSKIEWHVVAKHLIEAGELEGMAWLPSYQPKAEITRFAPLIRSFAANEVEGLNDVLRSAREKDLADALSHVRKGVWIDPRCMELLRQARYPYPHIDESIARLDAPRGSTEDVFDHRRAFFVNGSSSEAYHFKVVPTRKEADVFALEIHKQAALTYSAAAFDSDALATIQGWMSPANLCAPWVNIVKGALIESLGTGAEDIDSSLIARFTADLPGPIPPPKDSTNIGEQLLTYRLEAVRWMVNGFSRRLIFERDAMMQGAAEIQRATPSPYLPFHCFEVGAGSPNFEDLTIGQVWLVVRPGSRFARFKRAPEDSSTLWPAILSQISAEGTLVGAFYVPAIRSPHDGGAFARLLEQQFPHDWKAALDRSYAIRQSIVNDIFSRVRTSPGIDEPVRQGLIEAEKSRPHQHRHWLSGRDVEQSADSFRVSARIAESRDVVRSDRELDDAPVTDQDSFDHPQYDRLLMRLERDAERLINLLYGSWREATNSPVSKPRMTVAIEWQPKIVETYYPAGADSTSPVNEDLGYADMAIWFHDYALIAGKPRLMPARSCLMVLCRPQLSSVAKVMRELKEFSSRHREASDEKPVATEYWGLLTTNALHERTFLAQGYRYLNPAEPTLWVDH